MRPLKFRIWINDDNGYKYFDLLDLIEDHGTIEQYRKIDYFGIEITDKTIIQQYSCLNDKNGKEIYEGDIVLIYDEYTDKILDYGIGPTYHEMHISQVIFKSNSFGVNINETGNFFSKKRFYSFSEVGEELVGFDELEVIGNICENEDLLKKQ